MYHAAVYLARSYYQLNKMKQINIDKSYDVWY